MASCLTCRRRKVKCDGRPNICKRCEKLSLECLRDGPPATFSPVQSSADYTQAGHKRLRISTACKRCREKKLKCDAQRPSCSLCVKKATSCVYPSAILRHSPLVETPIPSTTDPVVLDRPVRRASSTASLQRATLLLQTPRWTRVASSDTHESQSNPLSPMPLSSVVNSVDIGNNSHSSSLALQLQGLEVPSGGDLLPYLDSFLENVHPISCNNFLHPGCLCEGLDLAPPLLLLALCSSSSKFMPTPDSHENGLKWAEEAKWLVMKSLNRLSTLTISAIQFLALHEVHEGNFTSALSLSGIGVQMAIQLELHVLDQSGVFLEQECRRRLVWAVYVADLLFNGYKSNLDEAVLMDLPLPCNIWSFTQGVPCRTLTLRQLQQHVKDTTIQQATNHCAYLISILVLRGKILEYVRTAHYRAITPWHQESDFYTLREELRLWKANLPPNYTFVERSMFMFRVSRHLDIFLMIHVYYMQCCLILFGACTKDCFSSVATEEPPNEFLQRCDEDCSSHAIEMATLIQRVLKVEPNHVFRDPWLGTCLWDALLVLLPYTSAQPRGSPEMDRSVKYLNLILTALRNTMNKIPLARKIYHYCCASIKYRELDGVLGLPSADTQHIDTNPRWFNQRDRLIYKQRYPFLAANEQNESLEWDYLFKTTRITESRGVTRQNTPAPTGSAATKSVMPFELGSTQHNANDPSQTDAGQNQLLSEWPIDDVQWWQMQQMEYNQTASPFGLSGLHNGTSNERHPDGGSVF